MVDRSAPNPILAEGPDLHASGFGFLGDHAPLAADAKQALVAENLRRLEEDLWAGSLTFRSRPRIADVQFSNLCNMACTMCYPDGNPPLERMPPALVEKLARDVFPHASVLVPFAGSEPLIHTWDLTRDVAARFGLELDIVTNVQFLDERKFRELEPHVRSIRLSVDSHIPEVYAAIRRRSRPKIVFRNLALAARLCREHGIEPRVNAVFMKENADHLDRTVAWFGDLGIPTVILLQYHYTTPAMAASDPYQALPLERIEALFQRIRDVAREKEIRVIFDLDRKETVDHRPDGVAYRESSENDAWVDRLRCYYPGFCLQAVNRVKVKADGAVYPCCVADGDDLRLGNLHESSFEEIWNGPESRDLRRAMITQDLPAACRDCGFVRSWILPEQAWAPFVDASARELGADPAEPAAGFALSEPDHMVRTRSAPVLRWSPPADPVDRFVVVLAAGGEVHAGNLSLTVPGDATELVLTEDQWRGLRANLGQWWTVFALRDGGGAIRATTIRCLIRHQDIPRVERSTLYDLDTASLKFSGVSDERRALRPRSPVEEGAS